MTEREKWNAVIHNDAAFDGAFYYGVKTTNIFCRPSCPSRVPHRENIVFFDTAEQAAAAGFRPCKRCRPDIAGYAPGDTLCEQAKRIIEQRHNDETAMKAELKSLGVNETHLSRLFLKRYGVTPYRYMRSLRISNAQEMISLGGSITLTAYECGYGSMTAFYNDFKRNAGMTPGQYAKSESKPY